MTYQGSGCSIWSVEIIPSCITIWDHSSFKGWGGTFDPVGRARRSVLAPDSDGQVQQLCGRSSRPSVLQQLRLVQVNRAQIVLDLSMSVQWAGSGQLLVPNPLLVPEFPPRCREGALNTELSKQPMRMISRGEAFSGSGGRWAIKGMCHWLLPRRCLIRAALPTISQHRWYLRWLNALPDLSYGQNNSPD